MTDEAGMFIRAVKHEDDSLSYAVTFIGDDPEQTNRWFDVINCTTGEIERVEGNRQVIEALLDEAADNKVLLNNQDARRLAGLYDRIQTKAADQVWIGETQFHINWVTDNLN